MFGKKLKQELADLRDSINRVRMLTLERDNHTYTLQRRQNDAILRLEDRVNALVTRVGYLECDHDEEYIALDMVAGVPMWKCNKCGDVWRQDE